MGDAMNNSAKIDSSVPIDWKLYTISASITLSAAPLLL